MKHKLKNKRRQTEDSSNRNLSQSPKNREANSSEDFENAGLDSSESKNFGQSNRGQSSDRNHSKQQMGRSHSGRSQWSEEEDMRGDSSLERDRLSMNRGRGYEEEGNNQPFSNRSRENESQWGSERSRRNWQNEGRDTAGQSYDSGRFMTERSNADQGSGRNWQDSSRGFSDRDRFNDWDTRGSGRSERFGNNRSDRDYRDQSGDRDRYQESYRSNRDRGNQSDDSRYRA